MNPNIKNIEYIKNDDNDDNNELLNNYIMIEKIGSGSFGDVFLAKRKDGGYVAAKTEDKIKSPRIYNEYKIYHYLHKNNFNVGLPKIHEFIETRDFNIMFMQLLGPSLEDLFNKSNRKFKLETVFLLAIQLMDLISQLHRNFFIHRDIKPNNFLINRNLTQEQIYIMDFGLSKKYMVDNKHIKFRNKRSLIGTARYASINMHMGIEPSRRDDLESIGYMLIYFLNGSLPWQGVKKKKGIDHLQIIGEIKMSTNLDTLCEDVPQSFKMYLEYCRQLKFDQTPDYVYMKRLFEIDSETLNIKPQYEWINK
jgi:serine/threonine protein kinase